MADGNNGQAGKSAQPPDGAPGGEAGVVSAELTAIGLEDTAKLIPHDIVAGVIALGEGALVTAPDPIHDAAKGLTIAAEVTAAGFRITQNVNENCQVSADQTLTRTISDKLDALNTLLNCPYAILFIGDRSVDRSRVGRRLAGAACDSASTAEGGALGSTGRGSGRRGRPAQVQSCWSGAQGWSTPCPAAATRAR